MITSKFKRPDGSRIKAGYIGIALPPDDDTHAESYAKIGINEDGHLDVFIVDTASHPRHPDFGKRPSPSLLDLPFRVVYPLLQEALFILIDNVSLTDAGFSKVLHTIYPKENI